MRLSSQTSLQSKWFSPCCSHVGWPQRRRGRRWRTAGALSGLKTACPLLVIFGNTTPWLSLTECRNTVHICGTRWSYIPRLKCKVLRKKNYDVQSHLLKTDTDFQTFNDSLIYLHSWPLNRIPSGFTQESFLIIWQSILLSLESQEEAKWFVLYA